MPKRRVLVTGSSSGIGAGIAKRFGQAGDSVLVHYSKNLDGANRVASAIADSGAEAKIFKADLRQESEIESLFEFIDSEWGGINVLVNNAGVVHKAPILDTDAESFDDVMNVNLRAPYLLAREAATRMLASQSGGSIVNITSIYARRAPENFVAYTASKAALDAATRVMALEWAPRIRVNAVAPGIVPVERTEAAFRETGERWIPHIPAGRFGLPNDVAELTFFICSEQAGWMTGHTHTVDGGMLLNPNTPKRTNT